MLRVLHVSLTDEQKRLRLEAYGASEVATVVGRGYGTLVELYESKVKPNYDEDLDNMLPAELGTLEEEPVARVYARRTGTFVVPCPTFRHPKLPLAIATPDRARFTNEKERDEALAADSSGMLNPEMLWTADRLVEVKTHAARFRRDYGPAGTGQVPEHEAIQTTWQMGVTGMSIVDVPVLFRGDWGVKLEIFTVGFNEELFDWLYESVERFHTDYVLKRVPPPPDGSDEYDKAMERLHTMVRKAPITATDADEELMLRWAKFAEVERRAGVFKRLTGQALMERIGEAGGLLSPSLGKLSWISVREGSTIDWRKAANDALALGGLCLNAFDSLRQHGEHISEENRAKLAERLKAIIPEATKPKAGYRYLKLYPKGEAELQLARLQIAMDALDEGNAGSTAASTQDGEAT